MASSRSQCFVASGSFRTRQASSSFRWQGSVTCADGASRETTAAERVDVGHKECERARGASSGLGTGKRLRNCPPFNSLMASSRSQCLAAGSGGLRSRQTSSSSRRRAVFTRAEHASWRMGSVSTTPYTGECIALVFILALMTVALCRWTVSAPTDRMWTRQRGGWLRQRGSLAQKVTGLCVGSMGPTVDIGERFSVFASVLWLTMLAACRQTVSTPAGGILTHQPNGRFWWREGTARMVYTSKDLDMDSMNAAPGGRERFIAFGHILTLTA